MAPVAHSPQRDASTADELRDRPLLAYVGLVFALAIPFWLVAARTGAQLLPGLPVSALMVVCPLIAASLLVFRSSGTAGWCVSTVAMRVLIVWLYSNTGSVFATILTHAMGNLSMFLFPNDGSAYDPHVAGALLAVVAAIATVMWGPRTLARFRSPH